MKRCTLELDDFHTQRHDVLGWMREMKATFPQFKITLFTLLGPSNFRALERLAATDWTELCLHGWDHFTEPSWGYWEARHYLEMADDLGFFIRIFKMPWNRWPRVGFFKALGEYGYALRTPKWAQQISAFFFSVKNSKMQADTLWLHPHGLLEVELEIDKDAEFFFVSQLA